MKKHDIVKYYSATMELENLVRTMNRREPYLCTNFLDIRRMSREDILSEIDYSGKRLTNWFTRWDKEEKPIIDFLWKHLFHYDEDEHILFLGTQRTYPSWKIKQYFRENAPELNLSVSSPCTKNRKILCR